MVHSTMTYQRFPRRERGKLRKWLDWPRWLLLVWLSSVILVFVPVLPEIITTAAVGATFGWYGIKWLVRKGHSSRSSD